MIQNELIKSQQTGLPSKILFDIKSEGNKHTYTITPAFIHQFFVEYPKVEKYYKELVPDKVNYLLL